MKAHTLNGCRNDTVSLLLWLLKYLACIQVVPVSENEGVREENDEEGSQDSLLNITAAKSLEVLVPKGIESIT